MGKKILFLIILAFGLKYIFGTATNATRELKQTQAQVFGP